jgi:hypothetical protein
MEPARATYDKNGNLVCPACAARNQIAEGETRAVSSIAGTALGVFVGGILSWTCLNAFFILSVVTIASGVGWLVMIARVPEYRARMGSKFILCVVGVSVGLGLAAMPLLFLALGVSGALLGR